MLTKEEFLKRKIELKNQLILLTEIEIAEIEKELMAATLATEKPEMLRACRLNMSKL